MYVLLWDPDGTVKHVDTWTEVIMFLSTVVIPSKTISLLTARTKASCETSRERLLVILNDAGAVTNTLYVYHSPDVPVVKTKS
jgi:hypothetical protein